MDSAVVDLVLNGLEEVVVSYRVLTWFGRGAGNEQDTGLGLGEKVGSFGVAADPIGPLGIPIGDLGAEGVGVVEGTKRGLIILVRLLGLGFGLVLLG